MNNADLVQEVVGILLQEDRIDDLLARYPQLKLDRYTLEQWKQYDPTGERAKYLPWMVKQVADGGLRMPQDSDHMRDQLREFERLVTLPAFTGSRDIQSYTWPDLDKTVTDFLHLRSRSEEERAAKKAKKTGDLGAGREGVTSVAQHGDLNVLKITNAVSLAHWAWKAYSAENPNWTGTPLTPPSPEELASKSPSLRDGLWCVRYTTYGLGYLKREPDGAFYLVLKNGGPYVGILLKDGQAKTLDNSGIPMGVAEEIYPAMKDLLSQAQAKGYGLENDLGVFKNLRFLHNEVQPGEVFRDDIDLSGSSIAELPPNLKFERSLNIGETPIRVIPAGTVIRSSLNAVGGALEFIDPSAELLGSVYASESQLKSLPDGLTVHNLDISHTPMRELPSGLKVRGKLSIEGTFITKFPDDIEISDNDTVTWSQPMDREELRRLFYLKSLPSMRQNWEKSPKIVNLSPKEKPKKWAAFKKQLWKHFQTSEEVDRYMKSQFIEKEVTSNKVE